MISTQYERTVGASGMKNIVFDDSRIRPGQNPVHFGFAL